MRFIQPVIFPGFGGDEELADAEIRAHGIETNLKQTSIYQDWQTFKATYPLLENKRLFEVYPDLACSVLEALFAPSTEPGLKALPALRAEMKGKVSMLDLVKDGLQIAKGVAL